MTNRKHSATGNAGDGAHAQEQANALYIAHQVHTLANLIFQRMTTGFGGSAAQGQHAGPSHPGAAAFQGMHGQSQHAWGHAGSTGSGSAHDATASVHGTGQNHFSPFGGTPGGAMNNAYPFFGMQSFGFNPYGVGNAAGAGFGFDPYFAGNSFGGTQSPFGFAPFGALYEGNPYGFLPQWMFGNHPGMQGGLVPQWGGMNTGNAAHDAACCNTGAGAPRAPFGPAPTLFYWYP